MPGWKTVDLLNNFFIFIISAEPYSIKLVREDSCKNCKRDQEEQGRFIYHYSGKNSFDPAATTSCAIARIIVTPRATCFAESSREPAVMPAATPDFLQMPTTRSII